jgi:hypothetical protein
MALRSIRLRYAKCLVRLYIVIMVTGVFTFIPLSNYIN